VTFRFVEPDLRLLDDLNADLVVCTFFEDQRPMRGLAGLLDWRLAGEISARLRERFTRGAAGDALLMPSRPRLTFDKVVLLGLGSRMAFDENAFRDGLAHIARVTSGLLSRRSVIELPGRGCDAIDAPRAAELTLEAVRAAPQIESFWLVEPEDARGPFTAAARTMVR
jgi:hypothetical protein